MKKILIVVMAMLLLSGCAVKEKGSFDSVSGSQPLTITDVPDTVLFNVEASSDLEYGTFNDYYAGFSVPYPSEWKVKQYSANYIAFVGDDKQISISHNLMTDPLTDNMKNFIDSFDSTARSEVLNLDYDAFNRRSGQTVTGIKIVSQEPLLISETYDNMKVSNDVNEYVSGVYCEKRYYINDGNINTMMSIVSKTSDDYSILDYMISNMRRVSIHYDDSRSVEGILLPGSFKASDVNLGQCKGSSYTPESSDAFAGCFVQIYSGQPDISQSVLNTVFRNAFGIAVENRYNDAGGLLFSDRIGASGTAILATVKTDVKNRILETGTAYKLELYSKDGKMIIIGYPSVKEEIVKILATK